MGVYFLTLKIIFIDGTDWTRWVKKRTNEIYEDVVRDRQNCTAADRDVLDLERQNLGENWSLLNRIHMNTAITGNDEVGSGNVFFYEED